MLVFYKNLQNFAEAHLFLIFIKNETQLFLKFYLILEHKNTPDFMSFQIQPWLPLMDSQQNI